MRDEIKRAVEALRRGGIILYPTDTVWGIGCDPTNEEAVNAVFKLKQRSDNKTMLILLDNSAKLQTYVQHVPDIAWDLIELTNSPLTIVYEGAKNLAANLISADGTIGIRITEEAFSKELCRQFRKPILSTSANISDTPAPTGFSDIEQLILDGVDYIVSYRQKETSKAKPSGIIKLNRDGTIKIIRK